MNELEQAWQAYLDALKGCCQMVKLTEFHTKETAKQINIAADNMLLVAFYIREYLKEI